MIFARPLLLCALLCAGSTASATPPTPTDTRASASTYQRLPPAGARYVDPDPVALNEMQQTPTLLSLSVRAPRYAARVLRTGIQGEVLVRVRVCRDGQPIEALVERSSGYPAMDQAAIDITRGARFQMPPSTPELGLWAAIPVRFALR